MQLRKHTWSTSAFIVAALALVSAFALHLDTRTTSAATFTVNSTGDAADATPGNGVCATAGAVCTLRAAIQEANALPGADTITFALGGGTPKIAPLNVLPDILETVTIDGDTGGATRIEISGENVVTFAPLGLATKSTGTVFDHLVVNRWHTGIRLDGSGSHKVTNSYIGTDTAGTSALANTSAGVSVISDFNTIEFNVLSGNLEAIVIDIPAGFNVINGNRIGTNAAGTGALPNGPSARGTLAIFGPNTTVSGNIISGNAGRGMYLRADSGIVDGNYVGLNISGAAALANTGDGIYVFGSSNSIGGVSGNYISGNGGFGIDIDQGSGNVVRNNHVGLAVGDAAAPNFIGIRVRATAGSTTIGGTSAADRNIVSGNTNEGMMVENVAVIQRNYVGTDTTGLAARPNGRAGIATTGAASVGTIGNGNVISANKGPGVSLGGTASLVANLIGVGSDATTPLGNGTQFRYTSPGVPGVEVFSSTHAIGSSSPGGENTIAHNNSTGVTVCPTCTNVLFYPNRAFSNGGLAVDLLQSGGGPAAHGNTLNDPLDADTGANNLQNHPVISGAETVGGVTTITASLHSTPSTSFIVGFYHNTTCDLLVHGEAETYLGSVLVSTDAAGNTGSFSFSPASPLPVGDFVVTGALRQVLPFDTSELSECASVGSGCAGDVDCDGWKNAAVVLHQAPSNTDSARDNCPALTNAPQANAVGNFIDLTPPKASDDLTWIRSDGIGDACDDDDDNDGLPDALEIQPGWCSTTTSYTTSPFKRDTDGDRRTDLIECAHGSDPTNPASVPVGGLCTVAATDSDGDGLRDYLEYCFFGSNPFSANSDGVDEFPLSTPPGGPLVASCSDGREVANLNGDRTVNVADTGILASAVGGGLYGSPPTPGLEWKVNMDMNQDGVINPADQGFLASKIGACP